MNILFYVSADRGCALRAAPNQDACMAIMGREIGTDNVEGIREATYKDLAWVRSMGGEVPRDADAMLAARERKTKGTR